MYPINDFSARALAQSETQQEALPTSITHLKQTQKFSSQVMLCWFPKEKSLICKPTYIEYLTCTRLYAKEISCIQSFNSSNPYSHFANKAATEAVQIR